MLRTSSSGSKSQAVRGLATVDPFQSKSTATVINDVLLAKIDIYVALALDAAHMYFSECMSMPQTGLFLGKVPTNNIK